MNSDMEYLTILNEGTAVKQYYVAMNLEAEGTPEALCRAALLLIRSAESGFEPAKTVFYFDFNRKGHMHVNKNRFKLIECAAKLGYTDAQYSIGARYRKGLDVKKDYSKAFSWFSEAAENGHLAASYYLGKMYFKGRGTEADPIKGLGYIVNAATLGYPEAQHDMGKMHESGRYLPKDPVEAFSWYLKSAYNGYFMSIYRVGEMYRDGIGVEKSGLNAISWFKKAGNIGYSIAWYTIANIYENGCAEVERNMDKALEYYEISEKRGYAVAPFHIGELHMAGVLLEKNVDKALEYYWRSSNKGYCPARLRLYGIYTEDPNHRDYVQAIRILELMKKENMEHLMIHAKWLLDG